VTGIGLGIRAEVSAKIFETEMRRDIDVPKPRLRRDTRLLKPHIYKISRIFLTLNFGQWHS